MKKQISVLLAMSLLLIALLSGCSKTPAEISAPEWETASGTASGFSYEVPADWTTTEDVTGQGSIIYIPADADVSVGTSNVNILVQDVSGQKAVSKMCIRDSLMTAALAGCGNSASSSQAGSSLSSHEESAASSVVESSQEESATAGTVSYTHLDVYKRQGEHFGTWQKAGTGGSLGRYRADNVCGKRNFCQLIWPTEQAAFRFVHTIFVIQWRKRAAEVFVDTVAAGHFSS